MPFESEDDQGRGLEGTSSDSSTQSRSILEGVVDYYSPRHEGDLPWERGDAYLLGQLGRAAVVVAGSLGALYFLSPFAITGTGGLLRVGTSVWGTAIFGLIAVFSAILLVGTALFVAPARRMLPHTMVLQTDVPWKEMVPEIGRRLKALGVVSKRRRIVSGGLFEGYDFPVRSEYAPLKILGSSLVFVTWGGARSLVVVPLPLFRHARWGQDIDRLVRDVLVWERPGKVTTPDARSLDEE